MKKAKPAGKELVHDEPFRYRTRARLLLQKGDLPRLVKRYLVQAFPCMDSQEQKGSGAPV